MKKIKAKCSTCGVTIPSRVRIIKKMICFDCKKERKREYTMNRYYKNHETI